jgi:hypothetical protein
MASKRPLRREKACVVASGCASASDRHRVELTRNRKTGTTG